MRIRCGLCGLGEDYLPGALPSTALFSRLCSALLAGIVVPLPVFSQQQGFPLWQTGSPEASFCALVNVYPEQRVFPQQAAAHASASGVNVGGMIGGAVVSRPLPAAVDLHAESFTPHTVWLPQPSALLAGAARTGALKR